MTLLEAISPTASELLRGTPGEGTGPTTHQLVLMPRKGIVRTEHHKVHAIRCDDGKPLCGGGHKATYVVMWQDDIGPVNCAACLKILENKAKRKT